MYYIFSTCIAIMNKYPNISKKMELLLESATVPLIVATDTMRPTAIGVSFNTCGLNIAFRSAQAFPAPMLFAWRQQSGKRRSGKVS